GMLSFTQTAPAFRGEFLQRGATTWVPCPRPGVGMGASIYGLNMPTPSRGHGTRALRDCVRSVGCDFSVVPSVYFPLTAYQCPSTIRALQPGFSRWHFRCNAFVARMCLPCLTGLTRTASSVRCAERIRLPFSLNHHQLRRQLNARLSQSSPRRRLHQRLPAY